MVRLVTAVMFSGIGLTGCSPTEQEIRLITKSGLSQTEMTRIEAGVRVLMTSCPGIIKYRGDWSQGAPVGIQTANMSDQRERGWADSVYVELVVADRPKDVPAEFKAWGQHCHFDISPDKEAGVSIAKTACVSLCKGSVADESLAFFPASRP